MVGCGGHSGGTEAGICCPAGRWGLESDSLGPPVPWPCQYLLAALLWDCSQEPPTSHPQPSLWGSGGHGSRAPVLLAMPSRWPCAPVCHPKALQAAWPGESQLGWGHKATGSMVLFVPADEVCPGLKSQEAEECQPANMCPSTAQGSHQASPRPWWRQAPAAQADPILSHRLPSGSFRAPEVKRGAGGGGVLAHTRPLRRCCRVRPEFWCWDCGSSNSLTRLPGRDSG